jgi:hypothetical protein
MDGFNVSNMKAQSLIWREMYIVEDEQVWNE